MPCTGLKIVTGGREDSGVAAAAFCAARAPRRHRTAATRTMNRKIVELQTPSTAIPSSTFHTAVAAVTASSFR